MMDLYFKKRNFWYPSLAFMIPFGIITLILALKGIWWGSDTTILASDGFHQYVIFNQTLRDILHGEGSFFYTFTSGLGLNFYGLFSYYLGSFFSPFVFFFTTKTMPDAIYLFTILKFGLTGLSSFISLTKIHKQLNKWMGILLSTSLSLMSFSTSQLELSNWLDVFIIVPLILLGLHKLVHRQGRLLYFITLTCLFLQNYYFGYMTAIFLTCWFFLYFSWGIEHRLAVLRDFIIVSLLAALSSLIVVLPVLLDLQTHGESLTEIVKLSTDQSWYFDLFAKNLIGNYDTTKFGALPMIFVGLLPLLLSSLFFLLPSIKPRVKVCYASFLLFLIASFYLSPLDLFWQGMHAPNMFLHRYAWVFSISLIFLAAETLTRLHLIRLRQVLLVFGLVSMGFIGTFLVKNQYPFLASIQFVLTFEFLLVYLILFLSFLYKWLPRKHLTILTLLFVFVELSLHTYYQVEGIATEWNFPSRSAYEKQLPEIEKLVKTSKKLERDFFRTERLLPQTGNDSMKYNYNGISQFSSIRNRLSSTTLDQLGFRSDGTNLNLRYQNNTLIADSLFAIRYNLAENNPRKFGFTAIQSEDEMTLYQNQYAQQLAILTDSVYKDVSFSSLTLDNQTLFLNQLTGLHHQYYQALIPISSTNISEFSTKKVVNTSDNQDTATAEYTLFITKNSQVYLSLPNLHFSNESQKSVQIIVNNSSTSFTVDNTFSLFNIGDFTEEGTQKVTLRFPQNLQVSFDTPTFYRLDLVAYQDAMVNLQEKEIHTQVKNGQLYTQYTSKNDASILFTLPYDKGWTATQNGKPLTIQKAQNGLMTVDVKKGSGNIHLTFLPNGLLLGSGLSILGILFFLFYDWLLRKQKNRLIS